MLEVSATKARTPAYAQQMKATGTAASQRQKKSNAVNGLVLSRLA